MNDDPVKGRSIVVLQVFEHLFIEMDHITDCKLGNLSRGAFVASLVHVLIGDPVKSLEGLENVFLRFHRIFVLNVKMPNGSKKPIPVIQSDLRNILPQTLE